MFAIPMFRGGGGGGGGGATLYKEIKNVNVDKEIELNMQKMNAIFPINRILLNIDYRASKRRLLRKFALVRKIMEDSLEMK